MKREFRYCDRCSANLTNELEVCREITIQCVSELEGNKDMTELELCDFCYGQLIGFVGKINPFTGLHFVPVQRS
jgi:hypothetical protein